MIHNCTNNHWAVFLFHPKARVERLREVVVECVKVSEATRGHLIERQGVTRPVQIDSNLVGAKWRSRYFHSLVVMLSNKLILRAVQTPGLVSVAKTTDMRTHPARHSPHRNSNVHPVPSPLHLPVEPLGEALVAEHLGDTLKPVGVIGVLLLLSDPCHLLSTFVQKERPCSCVRIEYQCASVCSKYHPSIPTLILQSGRRGAGAYPSSHWARGTLFTFSLFTSNWLNSSLMNTYLTKMVFSQVSTAAEESGDECPLNKGVRAQSSWQCYSLFTCLKWKNSWRVAGRTESSS